MKLQNGVVARLLESPMHGLLSGTVDLIRYETRRSGRTITTPTQYVLLGDDVLIMVGHPELKTWWRNFETERDVDVLIRRTWLPMRGHVIRGAEDPEPTAALLNSYLARFPRAARALGDGTREAQVKAAVFVRCHPQ